MMTALALLTALAMLGAVAFWWVRRCNPAAVANSPTGRVAPGCDLGQQLLMASSAEGGGSGGVAKRRKAGGPSRRAFLRNSMAGGFLVTLGGFGGASLAYLWPDLRGGFGAELEAGEEEALLEEIRANEAPVQFPEGRAYLVEYDPEEDPEGEYAEITNGARIMALFWTCVHLGCKVPWCQSSQWFECPCHRSRYNRWGEYADGPAPRGLDRFAVRVEDGTLIIDTSETITGPSRTTDTLQQDPEGASCL